MLRAFVDNRDASAIETHLLKSRFVSAQRGKKTRSAASRYLRLRLENSNRRLQFLTYPPKKEKERHAKREIRAVGRSVSTHTASPPLPTLTVEE